jgi:RimJ/RimL family protein N-acetyltransferase
MPPRRGDESSPHHRPTGRTARAVIETAHLTLRPFADDDVDPLFAIQGDREAMRHTYAAPSRAECAHRLRTFAALESMLGFAPWTAVLRTEARVIGWGGLCIDPFDPGWGIEVSYFFHSTYWGSGYATELVRRAPARLRHAIAAGHRGLRETRERCVSPCAASLRHARSGTRSRTFF